MLHCGAHYVNRAAVEAAPVPEALGRFHCPTPHIGFVNLVEEQLDKHNLAITEEGFGLTNDGNRFFGLLQLDHQTADYSTMLALRSSHDESFARGVAIGNRVFICDNLSMTGSHVIKTKNTKRVMERLPGLVSEAVAHLPAEIERQDKLIEQLKQLDLSGILAENLIVEMVRRSIVPPSRIGKVINIWDNERGAGDDEDYEPRYLVNGEATAWCLFNAATQVLKPSGQRGNVPAAIDRTLDLTHLFEEEMA
jgi:hypothetical protein